MNDYQKKLEECESAVREGRGQLVAKLLADLSISKLPRDFRVRFANVCRRAQLLHLALKILTPAIRASEQNPLEAAPTSAELAEYSVLLIRFGAVREAIQKLSLADAQQTPETYLYRAFAHFNRWDYASALPSLQAYLESDLAPNMRLIGQVNLTAAQVSLRMQDEALEQLAKNIAEAKRQNYSRLRANCLELRAQVYLLKDDDRRARRDLESAAQLLGGETSFDELFVRKWLAVLDARRENSTLPLDAFRAEAIARGDSESTRDADFNILKLKFDDEGFHRLYFGTPFVAYRERICVDLKARAMRTSFFFGDRDPTSELDLRAKEADLKAGGKIHLLLSLLARDFYRPLRLGALFSELFPGEFFDIDSSPQRVHQLLYRTRNWLKEKNLAVSIEEENESYRLKFGEGCAFLVSNEIESVDRDSSRFEILKLKFASDSWGFTAQEAAAELGISIKSFQTQSREWLAEGKILRMGAGRATKYVFSSPETGFGLDARKTS